ncbi:MAG: glycosyltransferase [Anaerolineae bacterium]
MESNVQQSYNVLMLAPTMFFADYGCHVRILEEALVLKKLGHAVTILAYPNGRDIAGLDVRRCAGVPFNYRLVVGSSRHKIYLDVMLAFKALGHVMRHKPDVIHAHLHEGGLLGWGLSKLTGAPLIFDFQGSLTGEMVDHNFLRPTSPARRAH